MVQMIAATSTTEAAGRLDRWFAACPNAAVAFSGGVDSALVAYWARRCLGRKRVTAWTADSPSLKRKDLEEARTFCRQYDIPLRELATDEVDDPDYASNPVNRCYFCKSTLYDTLVRSLQSEAGDYWICSGANLDDQSDYRPGLQAAAEASVRHPLLECAIGKTIIRELARECGLKVWDKPASPCLSSRIPYGQPVTRDKLAQIESAESWLHQHGFPVARVRHFGAKAVIEVPVTVQAQLREILSEVRESFLRIGFVSVEVDSEGFVSGKLNRAIAAAALRTTS